MSPTTLPSTLAESGHSAEPRDGRGASAAGGLESAGRVEALAAAAGGLVFQGRARRAAREWLWAAAVVGLLTAAAFAAAWAFPLPERLSSPPSTVVEYRDGTAAHVFLAPDERWRIPVRLSELDPSYVPALLAIEDQRFYHHSGVDPLAVVRAALTNLRRSERVSGASTLTMQLVRVLEPRPRTLRSKLIETARALQLELRLSKDEILAAYLQFVPYGRNVEGLEAASLSYFGHSARHLSAAEVATLLAVPQQPGLRFPSPANAQRLAQARDSLAQRLAREGALPLGTRGRSAQVLEDVRSSSVPAELLRFPREAPHASVWLRRQRPKEERLRSTLDAGTQRTLERLVAHERLALAQAGIHNGVVVVLDHEKGELQGLVGNLDFFDAEHGGQLLGFELPRSPGSALKPLLYALAVDEGVAGPEQLMRDVPVAYGTWTPKNFDGGHAGLVRLEDALAQSLNLPFVELLRRLEVKRVLSSLRAHGVQSLRPEPGHYGLSLAVGGVELTPLELAEVYGTLARGGVALPSAALVDDERASPRRLYAPGAAHLTRLGLEQRDRPDFPERRRLTGVPAHIAWKTGTSYGYRDAWTAGFDGARTVVVWLGNFDASPSAQLVGAHAAAPLFFDVMEALGRPKDPHGDRVPEDLLRLEVCSFSGMLPSEACPHRKETLALRQAVPTERCPYHQRLELERATGLRVSPRCRAGRDHEEKDVLVLPAAVRRYLRDVGTGVQEPPAWAPGCEVLAGGALEIVSPPPGQTALLLPGVPAAEQELPFEAEGAGGGVHLSWFLDGELLGSARANERWWWTPRLGPHEVLVMDETGRQHRVEFEVRERR